MIVIGICEKQKCEVEELRKIIEKHCFRKGIEVSVLILENIEIILQKMQYLDILFYDMDISQVDSIELGRKFYRGNNECKIIVTSKQETYFKEAFKMNAFRWISKPYVRDEVEEAIESSFETVANMNKIQFYQKRIPYEVSQMDISYIISYGSFIEAKIGNEKMRKNISLTKMEELIDPKIFFRLNRKCTVNLLKIDRYEKGLIHMGEKVISISRRRQKQFDRAFQQLKKEKV